MCVCVCYGGRQCKQKMKVIKKSNKISDGGNIIRISLIEPNKLRQLLGASSNNPIEELSIIDFSQGELKDNVNLLIKHLKTRKME